LESVLHPSILGYKKDMKVSLIGNLTADVDT